MICYWTKKNYETNTLKLRVFPKIMRVWIWPHVNLEFTTGHMRPSRAMACVGYRRIKRLDEILSA